MINKSATPALFFQMPGKTFTLAVAVFSLSIALHSACFGATLPKLPVDLTKALDEQWTSRLTANLKSSATSVTPITEIKLGLGGGSCTSPSFMRFFSCGGCLAYSKANFQNLYPDDLSIVLLEATSIKILVLETAAPITPKREVKLIDNTIDG